MTTAGVFVLCEKMDKSLENVIQNIREKQTKKHTLKSPM